MSRSGIIILVVGVTVFGVPIAGSITLLAALTTLFITANLAVGYTFSTLARNWSSLMASAPLAA